MNQYFSGKGLLYYIQVCLAYENDQWSSCPAEVAKMLDSSYSDWNISIADYGSTIAINGTYRRDSQFKASEEQRGQDVQAYRSLSSSMKDEIILCNMKSRALLNWLAAHND